jgi:putative nucleotidyltransferase with HDIG domain
MTRVGGRPGANPLNQKLLADADRLGDADGVATPSEVRDLAKTMATRTPASWDVEHAQRAEAARTLATQVTQPTSTLDPALTRLPAPLRRLALELDAAWGNGDGKVSVQELDRVARYYLAALPFFSREAGALLELAKHLNLELPAQGGTADNVLQLRLALPKLEKQEVTAARPFRALFDEALQASDAPGAPELLRSATKHSPKWHCLSILEHTAVAVDAARTLSNAVGVDWKDAGAAMLLHDVGKILERQVRQQDGKVSYNFWDHEAAGAEWLQQRHVPKEVVFQVRHHMDLRAMTEQGMWEASGPDKDRLARMLTVYMADQVAKGNKPDQLESLQNETPKILALCKRAGIDGGKLFATADALRARHFPQPA